MGERKTSVSVAYDIAIEYSLLNLIATSPDTLTASDVAQGTADGLFFTDLNIDFLSRGATADNTFILINSPSAAAGRYVIREMVASAGRVHSVRLERVNEDGVP